MAVAFAMPAAAALAQGPGSMPPSSDGHTHLVRAYQGRPGRPEHTERFSRKVRLGKDGRVSVSNISGDIVVTTSSGDEVSIEATKRTRRNENELATTHIVVDERPGRVDIRTEGERGIRDSGDVTVDYTVSVPASAAVELRSVSGSLKISGARGSVRAETVSGDVALNDTPHLEIAKSVSGSVTVSGISTDGDLSLSSISGNIVAKSVKVHALDVSSVSGDLNVADIGCERLTAKSVSGSVDYSGTLAKGGAYDFNVHSGDVRLTLSNPSGFVLNATSFSGSIRSDLPLTFGGDQGPGSGAARERGRRPGPPNSRSMRATYGDGSATVTVRTFSGDVVIAKR